MDIDFIAYFYFFSDIFEFLFENFGTPFGTIDLPLRSFSYYFIDYFVFYLIGI